MRSKIKYILLTAQRDFLFIGLMIAIAATASIGIFLGSNALSEAEQMSLVYAAGGSRLVLITGLIIFTVFSIRRFFENREIDLMLVRPISRAKFIFAFWIGFGMVALFFSLFTGLILYGFIVYSFEVTDLKALVIWTFSLFLESMLVLALAMTAALILKSAVTAVMTALGFYVLSRMSGFILIIIFGPRPETFWGDSYKAVSSLLPRLDFFGKTEWLIYGVQNMNDVCLFLLQAGVYSFLLLSLSVVDFQRKEF